MDLLVIVDKEDFRLRRELSKKTAKAMRTSWAVLLGGEARGSVPERWAGRAW
ncbi:MAG: hypothetical protein ACYDHX_17455 [Methanothrix sp.]